MSEILATAQPAKPPVNWPRINKGKRLAVKHYRGVVGQILVDELDSWANSGYQFGGKQLIDRLLAHLEHLEKVAEDRERFKTLAQAAEDVGVVHRSEVEG